MREVTVTAKHFNFDGSVELVKTSRHKEGYRVDERASVDYPFHKVSIGYDGENYEVFATVFNSDNKMVAQYTLTPDPTQE